MCGIVGVWHADDAHYDFDGYLLSLKSRGPDCSWHSKWKRLQIGHTRLAILDQAKLASQEDVSGQNIDVLLNGEIWNYRELGQRYGYLGTEAAVIRALYLEYGIAFVSRIEGIFAIVILDRRDGTLFLVRDRFGVKPLYYAQSENGQYFGFASDPKSLCDIPGFQPAISLDYVANERVFGFSCNTHNLIRGIAQVIPGSYFKAKVSEKFIIEKTVHFVVNTNTETVISKQSEEQQIEILKFALQRQYSHSAHYPIGVLLSGGLDSSALVFLAAQLQLKDITCFYFGSTTNPDYEWANRVASEAGYALRTVPIDTTQAMSSLPANCYRSSGTSYALQVMAQAIRELEPEMRVLWCGEGCDELYGGYLLHRKPGDYIKRVSSNIRTIGFQTDLMKRFLELEERVLMGSDAAKEIHTFQQAEQLTNGHLIPFDMSFMSCGIEIRVPFLDDANVKFVQSVLNKQNYRYFSGKRLIEALLTKISPISDSLFFERKKQSLIGAFGELFTRLHTEVATFDWSTAKTKPYEQYSHGKFHRLWLRLCEHILVARRGHFPSIEKVSDLLGPDF